MTAAFVTLAGDALERMVERNLVAELVSGPGQGRGQGPGRKMDVVAQLFPGGELRAVALALPDSNGSTGSSMAEERLDVGRVAG